MRLLVDKRQDKSNLSAMHMLADHLMTMGKYEEAQEMERQVLVWMETNPRLGRDSPQAINARRILAKLVRMLGRRGKSEALLAEVLDTVEQMGDGKFAVYQDEERELNEKFKEEFGLLYPDTGRGWLD